MKKLLVLAIAVVALVGCKGAQSGTEGVSGVVEARQVGASDIAYIQMDSLVNNYNRYIDLGEAFEAKATKVQSELESRARRLENEMRDLEDKASKGLMTRSQIATTQEQIQQRATTYENDRQTLMTELADEEQVMTRQVTHAIMSYVEKYNAGYRFKMILTTSGGQPILHADPSMDITAEILRGLNDEYAAETKATK